MRMHLVASGQRRYGGEVIGHRWREPEVENQWSRVEASGGEMEGDRVGRDCQRKQVEV